MEAGIGECGVKEELWQHRTQTEYQLKSSGGISRDVVLKQK